MKKIIVVVVLIVAVGAAIPFIGGMLLEKNVRRVFADINALYADMGSDQSLEIIHYDRGYLASDYEWKLNFGQMASFYHTDALIVKDHARHGFTGVVATSSLEQNPWFTAFVEQQLQGQNPFHIQTTYGFLGDIQATVALDACSLAAGNETISVSPGTFLIETNARVKHVNLLGNWQGLSAADSLTVGPTSMQASLERFSTYVWQGSIDVGSKGVHIRHLTDVWDLESLKVNYLLDVSDDQTTLSAEARLALEGLHAREMPIEKASARLAVKGLDAKGYEAYMKMYMQTVMQLFGDMAAVNNDSQAARRIMNQRKAGLAMQMAAAYEKLMKKDLEFQITGVSLKLPQGDITGDLTLRLLKDLTLMQFLPVLGQPDLVLDMFYLESNARLPVGLTGENPKLMVPVYAGMQTGLFVRDGDYLVHRAETTGGKLMLNGKAVVLMR